jgi:hypothetical protein
MKWAVENGNAGGTICTLYELLNSDYREFQDIEQAILIKALELLETRGKLILLRQSGAPLEETGIKFL